MSITSGDVICNCPPRPTASGLRVRRVPGNPVGRDFVVGDIHGYRKALEELLELVRFDAACDRLFAVGDMVDRGPDSRGVVELARESWFYAVRGNHEHYLAKGFVWSHVGADWFLSLGCSEADEVQAFFRTLPHIIVVEGEDRFNIVHAQLSARYVEGDLGVFIDADVDADFYGFPGWIMPGSGAVNDFEAEILEGRTLAERVRMALAFGTSVVDPARAPGLSTTYCGHTRLPSVGYTMSHVLLDTGADSGGELTMVEHGCGKTWSVRT